MDTRPKTMNIITVCTFAIFCTQLEQVYSLSCYVCDVTSTLGYEAANEGCNMRGAEDCNNPQERACMIETYHPGPMFQVVKSCLPQCPVFVNTSATNVRCCMSDGCNDFITSPIVDQAEMKTQGQGPMYDKYPSNRPRMRGPPNRRNDFDIAPDHRGPPRHRTTTNTLPVSTTTASTTTTPDHRHQSTKLPGNGGSRRRMMKERKIVSSKSECVSSSRILVSTVIIMYLLNSFHK